MLSLSNVDPIALLSRNNNLEITLFTAGSY